MFESVVPEAFAKRNRHLFYGVLPLSIGVHGVFVGAALLGAVWHVAFPLDAPALVSAYSLVSIPDPPPPPPAPAVHPPRPQPAAPPPAGDLAPAIIPDTIPEVVDMPLALAPPPAPAPAVSSDAGGQPGGIPGSTGIAAPGPPPFPNDGRVHIERGKDLPLEIIDQTFPSYPADAKKLQLEDQVVIRYTIGKNGRVIDVRILSHANFASFDTAVLDAVRNWRYRPMLRGGKPVEVTYDLGINFVLIRH